MFAKELVGVMKDDLNNVCRDKLAKVGDPHPVATSTAGSWPEMVAALDLAQQDLPKFLETYFGDAPDKASRGIFSATSR